MNCDKSKEKQLELGHYMFSNCYIHGAPRTEQYHSSFPGAPKISRKIEFYIFTSGEARKNMNKTIIRTLYILKMLYTGCSMKEAILLLLSWGTYYLNNRWLLHWQFGLIVANQNKRTKTRALYILKMLNTWCSTEEAITLLPSWST